MDSMDIHAVVTLSVNIEWFVIWCCLNSHMSAVNTFQIFREIALSLKSIFYPTCISGIFIRRPTHKIILNLNNGICHNTDNTGNRSFIKIKISPITCKKKPDA